MILGSKYVSGYNFNNFKNNKATLKVVLVCISWSETVFNMTKMHGVNSVKYPKQHFFKTCGKNLNIIIITT
jgi:hypothetical protein